MKPTLEKYLEKPIIFFGTGRSGTTIISDAILQHEDLAWHSNYQELFPKLVGVNYMRRLFDNKFWRKRGINTQNHKGFINYMLFRPIERYNFWESITGPRIDFSRGFLLNEKATPEEVAKMREFFAKMVKYQGRKRLAFKITGPARMEYLMSIFPDAQFVYVTREPVATIRSWMEVAWNDKIVNQLWWTGAYSPEELKQAESLSSSAPLFAAFQYKKLMETTEHEIQKMNPDIYTGSYEEFVKGPSAFLHNILSFLNLPKSNLVEEFITTKIAVKDRNNRSAASAKTHIPEETKEQILKLLKAS